MITFYPRNIGLWQNQFKFQTESPYKLFESRDSFIKFLQDNNVRTDDPNFPLEFRKIDDTYCVTHSIYQRINIGWIFEKEYN